MELDKVILNRRSVRNYLPKLVPLDKIALLLEAARHAPSSGNLQDYRFVVVNDKEKKNKIAHASLSQYWMNTAPVFIVVCSDVQKLKTYYKDQAEKYLWQNSAATAMIISLKAVDLGLSSCWISIFDQKAVSRTLDLPENILPQIVLTIGYEEGKPLKKTLKTPLNKITFFNKYGTRIADLKEWVPEKYLHKIKKLLNFK